MGEPIAEVGYLAGICGSEDDTDWEKVLIDASRRLVVAIAAFTATLEVTQDTPGDLLTGIHGHIGGAWQKQPLQFGYSDVVSEALSNTNLSAGTNTLNSTTVPAGEIWVISNVSIAYVGTVPTNLQVSLNVGAIGTFVLYELTPTSALWYPVSGTWVLAEDDYVQGRVDGATSGDDLYFRYIGYRMDIDL